MATKKPKKILRFWTARRSGSAISISGVDGDGKAVLLTGVETIEGGTRPVAFKGNERFELR